MSDNIAIDINEEDIAQPFSVISENRKAYSQLNRIVLRDMNKNPYSLRECTLGFLHKYPKNHVSRWINNPEIFQDELRMMSRHLYLVSPHYKRLINYFATMHQYSYIVQPYQFSIDAEIDIPKYKQAYNKALVKIEKMNLRHEMTKIAKVCFKEDIFYGYIYETRDSFYIRQLPPKYCRITSIQDGCFLYDFDFTYFLNRKNDIHLFGEEFEEKYMIFEEQGIRWQTLNPKKEFCVKLMEDVPFPVVPFLGVFEGIYDIDDYKTLKKAKAETDNYKVIALKVPTDDEGHFLIDRDILLEYYSALLDVLPENIGAFLTPMDSKDFNFENAGTADNNNVNNAIKTFWNDAGVSSIIFGDESKTSAALNISIKADMQMVFEFSRQLERNVNRLLKQETSKYKFKIQFLDITLYNRDEMYNEYLKGAQSSLPSTTLACASINMQPIDMVGVNFIENEILDLPNRLVSLKTSYTRSAEDNEGGAPTSEERGAELSDAGEASRDNNVNEEY